MFVYIMPESTGQLLKVGLSKNPQQRLKRVRSEWSVDASLFAAIPCDDCPADKVEHAAHHLLTLSGLHVHHEWFSASPQQALWAIYRGKRYVRARYDKNGNYKWPSRAAPPDTAFPLFHNEAVGYVYMPVWRSTHGMN